MKNLVKCLIVLITSSLTAHASDSPMDKYLDKLDVPYMIMFEKSVKNHSTTLKCEVGNLRDAIRSGPDSGYLKIEFSTPEYKLTTNLSFNGVQDDVLNMLMIQSFYYPTGAKAGSTLLNTWVTDVRPNDFTGLLITGIASEDQHSSSHVTSNSSMTNYVAYVILRPQTGCPK